MPSKVLSLAVSSPCLTSSQLPFLSGRKTKPSTWPPKPVCSVTSYCFTFLPSLILLAKESSQESFFRWTLSHALFPGVHEAFGCTRKLSPPLLSAGELADVPVQIVGQESFSKGGAPVSPELSPKLDAHRIFCSLASCD